MRIIEIAALSNGAHRNQTPNYINVIPEGWAVIPSNMDTPNFPFGKITAEEINGVMTVTNWTPGVFPDPEPKPDPKPTTEDRVTALEQENSLFKAQIAAQSDQMDFYEECIVEMAAIVYA